MTEIKKFFLKDVRCFAGRQEFNIRPLTFLVGENSTGKSTVLGCMQALGNFVSMKQANFSDPRASFDLNVSPYKMGTFADVVRNTSDSAEKLRSFELGFGLEIDSVKFSLRTTLIERGSGTEPGVERIEFKFEKGSVVFEVTETEGQFRPFAAIKSLKHEIGPGKKPVYTLETSNLAALSLDFVLLGQMSGRLSSGDVGDARSSFAFSGSENAKGFFGFVEALSSQPENIGDLSRVQYNLWRFFLPYTYFSILSVAPIRSKPMRTYDHGTAVEDPEGSGVPMKLINMQQKDVKEWTKIRKNLAEFGKFSGLFTDIDIKRFGKSVNNPFQIRVTARGLKTSIIDVGYGVSQILPVLVGVFTAKPDTMFLVQQPEIHLHPKGQATLCSLFAEIAKNHDRSFVIETHSDYMIKRARIEIMKGNVSPDDVSLIYLEPVKNKVKVHNITFDENANFSPPKSYGEFFLQESNKVLGFED